MNLQGIFLGLLSLISVANAMERSLSSEAGSSDYPSKKIKIQDLNSKKEENVEEEAVRLQIGILAKQFRELTEQETILTLTHPAFSTNNQQTTQKSYREVGKLREKLEEEILMKQEEVASYEESLKDIQSILQEGYDESHEIILSILTLYHQSSYEDFLDYTVVINKKIKNLINLKNYLKKIQRKKASLIDNQMTEKNLIHFMKKEDSSFKGLMKTHAKLIKNILNDLGF